MLIPTYVDSSNIDAVGYQDTSKTLFIRFKSGTSYSYDEVPFTIFDAMKKVESVGQFFHKAIKGKFNYTKLEGNPFN